jgi:8-oxo-dGTP diphosphatase/2-hydroxy-dATP diphosphatase
LDPSSLSKRAIILQEFEHDPVLDPTGPGPVLEIHVYLADIARGALLNPQETDEMKPQWFDVAALPFDSMWADDRHWYPQLLDAAAPRFKAHFLFRGHDLILKQSLVPLTAVERKEMEDGDHVTRLV